MNKFLNIINRTRQVLNDLENKDKTNSIENLIELETSLQSLARESHDEAFKKVIKNEKKNSCKCHGTFHDEGCHLRIK